MPNDFELTCETEGGDEDGGRLDSWLAKKFPRYSRSQWQTVLASGFVYIGDRQADAKQHVKSGDSVRGRWPASKTTPAILEETLQPAIIYQDGDVIVINKPAGVAVYPPNPGSSRPSLLPWLRQHTDDSDPLRPGVVHRLDRETSGVMVVARTLEAKAFLIVAFKTRQVEKYYTVLVWGHLSDPKARVELPIERDPARYGKMRVGIGGKTAISEYQVVAEYPGCSLVRVRLITGRTHQIRVQFAYMGHSVVGDELYGQIRQHPGLNRQFLHSVQLSLTLPNGERNIFEAKLPHDLDSYLQGLA